MTRVEFHTGVGDELGLTCRLLRKAYRQGARVVVRAPAAWLQRLDRELWTVYEREFIPHLRVAAHEPASAQARRTPIWLVDGEAPQGHPPVLVSVDAEPVRDPAAYARIIEIVGAADEPTRRGRERWRAYLAAGLRPVLHAGATAAAHG